MSVRPDDVDMVTTNIIGSIMVAICREMGIVLMKTSYSTIFNEGLDFTCAIATPEGEMLAVADFVPSQIGGMPTRHPVLGQGAGARGHAPRRRDRP